jgi:hypothetical protein
MTGTGLSHSEIHGSKPVCGSPWLIATCYVLHRLLAPRHPPIALSSLITKFSFEANPERTQRNVNALNLCVVVKEQSHAGHTNRSWQNCAAVLVGLTGLEPVTLRLSSACSNQLSYRPNRADVFRLVELRRLELPTYSLQSYRSTN